MGTPCRIDVDSTWILRRYVEYQIRRISTSFHVLFRCNLANRKIHVVSTYFFFGVISVAEKSTFFPRTFFGVISLVKTFTLFLCTFFGCNFDGRKTHFVFTYVFRYNFDDRKIRLAGMYFFRQNFDG